MLEHAILMDAGLMSKGIGTHDGLVRLHGKAGDSGDQTRGAEDVFGLDPGVHVEQVLAGLDRHDDFFQGGIAGALAKPVDGALDLPSTGDYRGQRIGDCQTQVVVAMNGKHRSVSVGNTLEQLADHVGVLMRNGVADSVRDIDRTCAGVDGRLDDAAQEIDFRTPGVFAGKLHIGAEVARLGHRPNGLLDHLVRLHAQLVLHMNRAGGDKGMDTSGVGPGECFGSAFDIGIDGAGQATDGAVLDMVGHGFDGGEITRTGDGEAGLDHVHFQPLEGLGDAQLFFARHGGAGALLTVTQSGVEDDDAIIAAHRKVLTAAKRLSWGAVVRGLSREMNGAGRRSCVRRGDVAFTSPRNMCGAGTSACAITGQKRLGKTLRGFPPYECQTPR